MPSALVTASSTNPFVVGCFMAGALVAARAGRTGEIASANGAPVPDNAPMHRVVVVGGGFGGLQAAKHLASAPVELTLVDRRNFHLFQPLSYQVATGALSPGEVCYPLRAIFRRRPNVRVLMAEVEDLDLDAREVHVTPGAGDVPSLSLAYDTLIVAGGSAYSYFGHDEWART